ncbi:MAG: hypothetical protein J1E02_06560 [Coprobacter sp.]|nr:hypothetical protein [Coprobacter sp.]
MENKIHQILAEAVKNTPSPSAMGLLSAVGSILPYSLINSISKDKIEGIHIHPQIDKALIDRAKSVLQINDETIYYLAITNDNKDEGILSFIKKFFFFAITDKGIYNAQEKGNPGKKTAILWKDIKRIIRQSGRYGIGNKISVETYHNEIYELWPHMMGIETNSAVVDEFIVWLTDIFQEIQFALQEKQKLGTSLLIEYMSIDNDDIDKLTKFITKIEDNLITLQEESKAIALKILADAYYVIGITEEDIESNNRYMQKVLQYVQQYESLYDLDNEMRIFDALANMSIYYGTNKEYKYAKFVFGETDTRFDVLDTKIYQSYKNRILEYLPKNILDYEYKDRRFLVIDSSMSYLESEKFVVLPQNKLPEGIEFPIGHPQEGELYVCHPYRTNYYIPYEMHEFELFKDKMDELRLVLQTMGATLIRISDINGSEQHKTDKKHISIDGNFNGKVNKVHANADIKKTSDEYEMLRREYTTESHFEPQRMPYIPDRLVWYPQQPDWQRLFELRKNGLRKHRISVSVSRETQLTTQQQFGLKADFQALIVKTGVKINTDTDKMFENKTSSIWTLDVEFESLEILRARENAANDIAPAQIPAATLTKDVFSAEEQEYCAALAEYAADGELTERDLKLLARLAASLGIAPERAEEIHAIILNRN